MEEPQTKGKIDWKWVFKTLIVSLWPVWAVIGFWVLGDLRRPYMEMFGRFAYKYPWLGSCHAFLDNMLELIGMLSIIAIPLLIIASPALIIITMRLLVD